MKKMTGFIIVVLVVAIPLMTHAQEPDEGNRIVEANVVGLDYMGSLNPLRCNNPACQRIYNFLFPSLIGVNPETGNFAAAEEAKDGTLALRWDISDDGKEYTFYLREDATWSDGAPITANDLKFSYDAIASGDIESDLSGFVDAAIVAVEVIDDYTIKFIYAEASCDALDFARAVYPLPAHRFDNDYTQMTDSGFDHNPDVSAGIFSFLEMDDGQIVLVANRDYYGVTDGAIIPERFIYVDVPNSSAAVEMLLEGEINFLESPERGRRDDLIDDPDIQTYSFPTNAWNYIGLNLADPENPQNGLDEDGNPIDQGFHPIFGDVRVRRALQMGMNVQQMIDIVSLEQGTQMAANELPTSWALNPNLAPIPFDPEAASVLLDEAGWVLGENGIRECQNCQYAEKGMPMRFSILISGGSRNVERLALLFQDDMRKIGVSVEVEIQDFNTVIAKVTAQTFDAVLLGWTNSYPVDPDITQIFSAEADVVGSGFNFVSYHNPEALALNEQARVLPGCGPDERAQLYWQVQEMLKADQPYLWLYTVDDMYAARIEVNGFAPYPNLPYWNVQTWVIDRPQ